MLRRFKDINSKNFVFVIKLIWQTSPSLHVVNILIIILQSILPLINLYQIKLLFDAVSININHISQTETAVPILFKLAGITGVLIITNLLNSVGVLVRLKQNHTISEAILEKLHTKSIEIDLEYYENPDYYDTFHRTQADMPGHIFNTFNQLQSILQNLISLLALTSVLWILHWAIGIIILISVIPGIIVKVKFSKERFQLQQESTPTQRKAFYYDWLITNNYTAKELRIFNLGDFFVGKSKLIREDFFNKTYNIIKESTFYEAASKITEVIVVYGLFLFLIKRALNGYLSIGDLVMYYQIFNKSQVNIGSLLNGLTAIFEDSLFFKNLIEFLNYKTKISEPDVPVALPTEIKKVELKNLSFKYPGQAKFVLQNINLQIDTGDRIAIVGKSGSGKTSLIKLIGRLYNPTKGSVYINDIDYASFLVTALREKVSILFQDYVNYQIKASESISLGNINCKPNRKDIKEAATHAGADGFIQHLPLRYSSVLGKIFEFGEELSTGQWQRVALARAMFRDAPILILDEPSSSMDAITERLVFENISAATKNKILILISHRLTTIKFATCIYFLEDGKIVEYGPHDYLMKLNGKYTEMFNLQSVENFE